MSLVCLLSVTLWSYSATPPSAFTSSTARVPSPISPSTSSPPMLSQSASAKPVEPSSVVQPSATPREPSPGSLTYLDYKNGFRDLKFGEPPTANMVLKEDGGDSKYYARPGDDLLIGGTHMDQLIYGFYKNRMQAIRMKTKEISNSRALLEVLRQAYGSASQPNQFMQNYQWDGSKVIVTYDESPITRDATVWFFSEPLIAEQEADQKAKAKKGVGGL